ncbi:50S ribosomal protein L25 [Patescibacteria group bacterium]|nr:50S ribosomal protein L25 [Patescibacteria group bacterium]
MELKAKNRNITGKKVKNLRKNKVLPAVVFGKGQNSINIEVAYQEAFKTFKNAGETEIVDIDLEGTKYHCLIDEVSFHPVTDLLLHLNFRVVDLHKKIVVSVPLVVVNEELNEKIKQGEAIFLLQLDELEVEALPKNLPKHIEIEASLIKEIGDSLTLKDIKKLVDGEKVEIMGEDDDLIIATLDYATRLETEEETGPTSVEEVKIEEKGKKDEDGNVIEKAPEAKTPDKK